MNNRDAISGLFLALLSAGTCIMAYRLGLGTGTEPGPGFAAFGIAALLGLMAVWLLLQGLLKAAGGGKNREAVEAFLWRKPLLVLVILTGYGASLHHLGFSFSNFLLVTLLVWAVSRRRLRVALGVSLLTVACAHLLFVVGLGLALPTGSIWRLFGEWLGTGS